MLWRRKRSLADFAEEIRSHLALEADQLREERGAPPDPESERAEHSETLSPHKRRFMKADVGCC